MATAGGVVVSAYRSATTGYALSSTYTSTGASFSATGTSTSSFCFSSCVTSAKSF